MNVKLLFLLLFFFPFFSAFSQNSKLSFELISRIEDAKMGRLNANAEVSVFIRGDIEKIKNLVSSKAGVFKFSSGDIASVRLPLRALQSLSEEVFVERIEGSPSQMELFNDTMVYNNDLLPVFAGMSPLTQAYD